MKLERLAVFAWILFYLVVIEVGLEARAWSRRWPTPLFGQGQGSEVLESVDFGPTADFPFRSPFAEAHKPAGVTRYWLASASFAEDVQQPPDALFAHLAAQALRADGQPSQMLNCSRGGVTIAENLRDLDEGYARWLPDHVVLYQMSNDMDEISRLVLADSGGGMAPPIAKAEEPAEAGIDLPLMIDRFTEATITYAQLKNQISARMTRARVLSDDMGPRGEEAFELRIVQFIERTRALGTEPVLCTFATSHLEANLAALPEESANNLYRYNPHLSLRGWAASTARWNRALERVALEEGVALIDIAASIAGRADLFRDFTHFNAAGHEAMGAALATGLAELR